MSKLDQFLGCLCGVVLFFICALVFGFCTGWGSTQAIICYVAVAIFGGLSVLTYKWWKDEEKDPE